MILFLDCVTLSALYWLSEFNSLCFDHFWVLTFLFLSLSFGQIVNTNCISYLMEIIVFFDFILMETQLVRFFYPSVRQMILSVAHFQRGLHLNSQVILVQMIIIFLCSITFSTGCCLTCKIIPLKLEISLQPHWKVAERISEYQLWSNC